MSNIIKDKFPARLHAEKLVKELVQQLPDAEKTGTHAVFLQACPTVCRDDTDREMPYHQEANFNYLTGCLVPSSSVFITFAFDPESSPMVKHTLLIPPADPLETMWSVAPPTIEEALQSYDSDSILPTTSLSSVLEQAIISATSSYSIASSYPSIISPGPLITIHTLPLTLEYPPLPTTISKILPVPISDSAPLASPALSSPGLGTSAKKFGHNTVYLLKALHIARLTKTEYEIELIREANRITSGAHEVLMRELGRFAETRKAASGGQKIMRTGKEGIMQWEVESEGDAEALFVATCRRSGASQAYLPIVASGSRASTLHYVCNDRLFPSTSTARTPGDTSFVPRRLARGCCGDVSDHDHSTVTTELHNEAFGPQLLLIDAGCEWRGYASDVTRTIPVGNGGKYSERGGEIYELVLKMHKECEAMVKPGIHWDTIHLHAHEILVDEFLELGIFQGDAEDILQSGISAAFFPHGLGHSLGLDVHDSRQYLKSHHIDLPESSIETPAKLYTYLRIRQPLIEGMVLTVEPGCYFAPQLMDEHGVWDSEYVDTEVLKKYIGVGGVRIEDAVVVRSKGCENLTTVGRERAWVEGCCSGSA